MNLKAISPLIATVILIGITIIIAGILGAWATIYVTQRTQANATQVKCDVLVPQLFPTQCKYNETLLKLTVFINSRANQPLKGFNVVVEYPDKEPYLNSTDKTLEPASVLYLEFENIQPGFTSIRIKSVECPSIEITC